MKRGKEGASVFSKEYEFHASTELVDVIDNTGAGDVLNGVFLGLYMEGAEPSVALQVATWAASSSTRGYGRDAYPSRGEIEVLCAKALNCMHEG
jgi:sugar/nucleoside kinase (ribokinase family)